MSEGKSGYFDRRLLVRFVPSTLLFFVFQFSAWQSAAPAQNKSMEEVDILKYIISVGVSDRTDSIAGHTEIEFRARRFTRKLLLDFEGLTPTLVTQNDTPLTFRTDEKHLEIVLREALEEGQMARVSISYTGIPSDGLILRKNKYGRRTVFADNWPNRAHYWFPCKDHPSDKAAVRLRITVPERYSVVANGRLMRHKHNLDGTETFEYEENVEIPTYCMVFGAAEFDVLYPQGAAAAPISFWTYPEDMSDAQNDFARSDLMLTYFSRRFGPYPYEKLALVQSSTRFGGMENASAIFFSERSLGTPRNIEGTVAHEIAHQWFGDWVTPRDWPHLWLSEGFATYFGMQFFEFADGKETFRERLRRSRERYLESTEWHARPIVAPTPENLFDLLNPNNYTKGGWVLHMLRHLVGDTTFWKAIRRYVDTYRGGNAETRDLQAIFEAEYGRPLDWFFQQWVFHGGIPEIEVSMNWRETDGNLEVYLKQLQDGEPMRLPVDILFKGKDPQTKTFWLEKRQQRFEVYLSQKPEGIEVDPEVALLARFVVHKTADSSSQE